MPPRRLSLGPAPVLLLLLLLLLQHLLVAQVLLAGVGGWSGRASEPLWAAAALELPRLSPSSPAESVVVIKKVSQPSSSSSYSSSPFPPPSSIPDIKRGMLLVERDDVDGHDGRQRELKSLVFSSSPFRVETQAGTGEGDTEACLAELLAPLMAAAVGHEDRSSTLQWLRDDIQQQVAFFRSLVEMREEGTADRIGGSVRVKLELQTKAKCPRWHTDKVPLRLLCTYEGPSTQYLSDCDVDRRALLTGAPNERIHKGGVIHRPPLASPLVFIGGEEGVVHRSPDLLGTERRLLLTVDPSFD